MSKKRTAETISISQLYRMFPDEKSCRERLELARWGGTPVCPHCGSVDEIRMPPPSKPQAYWCKACRDHFTVTTGTCLHSTKKPLQDWIFAIYSVMTARKGVSAMQLSKELGCQYRTAWHMLHRIREACAGGEFTLEKIVEVDETYIGGRERNKHESKKLKAGRGPVGKTTVIGARERAERSPPRLLNVPMLKHYRASLPIMPPPMRLFTPTIPLPTTASHSITRLSSTVPGSTFEETYIPTASKAFGRCSNVRSPGCGTTSR